MARRSYEYHAPEKVCIEPLADIAKSGQWWFHFDPDHDHLIHSPCSQIAFNSNNEIIKYLGKIIQCILCDREFIPPDKFINEIEDYCYPCRKFLDYAI